MNLENELLQSTISSIIENIEVWDNSLSFLFSDCLGKLINKIIDRIIYHPETNSFSNSIFNTNLINLILKFYIDIIENTETDLTSYYIKGFNDIIETLSRYKKILVNHEIIEKVSFMGSFGKKNTLRKYSLFFCTCLIRVSFFNFKLLVSLYKILKNLLEINNNS